MVHSLAAARPDLVELAESVSFAARVEPHLLRRARLELMPGAGVELESDLWFSPLVESRTVEGLVLRADAAALLRQRVCGHDHARAVLARDLTLDAHAGAPPTVQLFEKLIWLWADGGWLARDKVEEALDSALAAMLGDADRAMDLALWAVRALPALPLEVRDSLAGWRLWLAASARLPAVPARRNDPPDAVAGALAELLPAAPQQIEVGVRLVASGIELSEPPGDGTHVMDVPRSSPLVLEVAPGARTVTMQPGTRQVVQVGEVERVPVTDSTTRNAVALTLTSRVDTLQPGAGGGLVLIGSGDGRFEIWNSHLDESLVSFEANAPGVACIDPDGRRVAIADASDEPPKSLEARGFAVVGVRDPEVRCMAFSPGPDGELAYGTSSGRVELLDGTRLSEGGQQGVDTLAWSLDGRLLAAGSFDFVAVFAGRELVADRQALGPMRALAFSPDGEQLLVVHNDRMRILAPLTGEELGRVMVFATDAAWSPDGSRVAGTGVDGVTRVWDVTSGKQVSAIERGAPRTTVSFGSDSSNLFIGGPPRLVHVETALGQTWSVAAIDAIAAREDLRRQLDALVDLLQAISLDFHMQLQGRRAESREETERSFGRGWEVEAEGYDAVRQAAEWALSSAWASAEGGEASGSGWRSWRDMMIKARAKLSGEPSLLESVAGFLDAMNEVLEHGRKAYGEKEYESGYPVDERNRDTLEEMGIMESVRWRDSEGPEGDWNLTGSYASVVDLFERAAPMLLERLERWLALPPATIDWDLRAPTAPESSEVYA
jgi:hypothetical protein